MEESKRGREEERKKEEGVKERGRRMGIRLHYLLKQLLVTQLFLVCIQAVLREKEQIQLVFTETVEVSDFHEGGGRLAGAGGRAEGGRGGRRRRNVKRRRRCRTRGERSSGRRRRRWGYGRIPSTSSSFFLATFLSLSSSSLSFNDSRFP
jgi:hypothetical protein